LCPTRPASRWLSRLQRRSLAKLRVTAMTIRDPETNFEQLWKTFHHRYPFFALRNVDWTTQYETYRPKVTRETSDDELFDIFCQMLAPLNDGHVELKAKASSTHERMYFNPEPKPRF
jgi:Tricorn protease C1 domain